MALEIKNTLLISKEDVLNKKYNLWIGFSYGNKWFTPENTKELIKFCLTYTNNSLLIWIPSRLYATNLKYIENKSRAEALRLAFEAGDKHKKEIQDIISGLSTEEQNKTTVANYDEIMTPKFIMQREMLMREFSKQLIFYELVMEIAKDILEARNRTTTKDRIESVSLYVLQELPLFLDGVTKIGQELVHTVVAYPGLGKLDHLVKQIKEDEKFITLKESLQITNRTGIIDVQ